MNELLNDSFQISLKFICITQLDNLTVEEREMRQLRKENQQLKMENVIIRPHGVFGYMTPKEYKKEFYKNCLKYC